MDLMAMIENAMTSPVNYLAILALAILHRARARPNTFAWLHAFKRPGIRYERRADIHQALLTLACAVICVRKLSKA